MNKDLIMDWDIAVTEYYELELIYFDWFAEAGKEGLDKDTMMKELIEDEYNYRINDTVEDLKEEIEYLQEYTRL